MKRIFYFLTLIVAIASCQDDDSFSTSTGTKLQFSVDTLKLDTVFSKTPSSTYSFWVHNRNNDGIRLSSVRLGKGNQTGFRVNVDGTYLDNNNGSQAHDLEIRRKDSILVFVELTAPMTARQEPTVVEDRLVFVMESGQEQSVCLYAWAWDAVKLYSPVIDRDSVIQSEVPIVVYGDFRINEGATLTLKNTMLYFHDGAGMEVYGNLDANDCLMRGDRLDRMFSYLPYDRVSGQWKGINIYTSSNSNRLINTKIRNSVQGVVCESESVDTTQCRLYMKDCVVHNCQGPGVKATNANIRLGGCQISNTLGDCLSVSGGMAEVSYCTLAQFYPFSADRGAALRFSSQAFPLLRLDCEGSILTGYEEDVVMGEQGSDASVAFNYAFRHCLLRTPAVTDDGHFSDIIWETPNDSIQGKQHFVRINEENLDYDFHLDAKSPAQGLGCYR